MINFGSAFLTQEANAYRARRIAAKAAAEAKLGREMSSDEASSFRAKWRADHAYPFASLDDVLDHIDRVVELAGIDAVGIGSDYDGVGDTLPTNLKDAASFPILIDGLLARGYEDAQIAKIMGENALRVWREVEKARKKRKF